MGRVWASNAAHSSIDLLCSYIRLTSEGYQIACMEHIKNQVLTLLSTKLPNSLEKIVLLAEKSLSWSSSATYNGTISSTTTQLLCRRLYTPDKSEHGKACIVLEVSYIGNSKRKSSRISMEQNLWHLLYIRSISLAFLHNWMFIALVL